MPPHDPFRQVRAETSEETQTRLHLVLAGMTFPATHWQIVATAEHHGADVLSLRQLYDLPAGAIYRNTTDVVNAVLMINATAKATASAPAEPGVYDAQNIGTWREPC